MAILVAASQCALAQPAIPQGVDQTPTRVLQIEQVLGAVSVQRAGRTEELRSGFLVFNQEQVMLSSRSRAHLALSRYGEIDIASAGTGPGVLSLEKLPFSSWAVDLETRLRLERGLLRVRWARAGDAKEWPLGVVIDRWSTQLGNGEFLFRHDERGILVCNVAGSLELSGEAAGQRQSLKPGSCAQIRPGESVQDASLSGSDWSELQVAILPSEPAQTVAGPPVSTAIDEAPTLKSADIPIVPPPPAASPPPSPEQAASSVTGTVTVPAEATEPTVPEPAGSVAITGVAPLPDPGLSLPEPAASAKTPPPAEPAAALPVSKPEQKKAAVVAADKSLPPAAAAPAAAPGADPAVPAPAPSSPAAAALPAAPPQAAPAETPTAVAPPVSMRPLAQADIPRVAPPTAAAAPGATAAVTAGPATMPVTAGLPPESTGPEWIVNVMTATDPEVAKQHVATLNEAGYPATLRTEMVRGRSSYRVVIGGISNEQGARRTAQLLASKMGYSAAWPLQKR